eukprot:Em0007g425a
MIDTGATVSLFKRTVWCQLEGEHGCSLSPWDGHKLVGVEGSPVSVCGVTTLHLDIAGTTFVSDFVVVDALGVDCIIGLDFLRKFEGVIDLPKNILQFRNVTVPLEKVPGKVSDHTDRRSELQRVALVETLAIPPFSEIQTTATVSSTDGTGVWLVEGSRFDLPILVAGALVTSLPGGQVPILIINPLPTEAVIHKGTNVATAIPFDEMMVAPVREDSNVPAEFEVSSCKRGLLHDMADRSAGDLTSEEKHRLYELLVEFADVFAESSDDMGRTGVVKHSIDTGTSHPIRQQCRRVPPFRREQAKKMIDDMLQKDIIQPSSSPWASPIILVPKKDGSLRFCIDYRKLNSVTRKDAYPLPRVDDTLEALSGSKWFSTLDLLCGYWQVEVEEKDRHKTAFCTREGLFEFKVMPFGLCNAPAVFQRLMDLVLSGIQWERCLVYIDDIVIMGKTFERHLQNLKLVLERLRRAGLKLKPSKCSLFQDKVVYLGHVVTRDGIHTDPEKVNAVSKWPVPTSGRDVQQFLGLVGYYRNYIQSFATIAKPLYQLTERGREFDWSKECSISFQELRSRLVAAPILAFPDFSKTFLLDTDACETGIGAVLSQEHDGLERVVAYASRTLSKAERKYCVTRKELLAVVTFMRHFRPYLLGHHFILRTDHSSLQWIYSMKEPEGQLARWLEQIQEFDVEVVHRRGKCHQNADALSRLQNADKSECPPKIKPPSQFSCSDGAKACTVQASKEPLSNIRELQGADEDVGPILQSVISRKVPDTSFCKGKSREFNQLVQQWEQLLFKNGILYRYHEDEGNSNVQVVVPKAARCQILKQLHEGAFGGHLGEAKTLNRLRERFYWPGYSEDAVEWCKTCPTCAARKNPSRKSRAPLQSVTAGYPLQLVAVDIVGPLTPSKTENTYILVASDYFTRWVEAYAIPNQEAVTVANKLVDEFFCRFSVPEQLHSDQGRQFEANVMQEVCRLLQIDKTRTTPYHPQSDGLVERFNRTMLAMLASTVEEDPSNWEQHLRKVCMAYNTSVQPSTGYTPFYLMFGRLARLPVDIMYGSCPTEPVLPHQYVKTLKDTLESAYTKARKHMHATAMRSEELYNRRVHGQEYEVGDLVWLNNPVVPRGRSRKLHCPWTGPFKIIKKLSSVVYRIQDKRPGSRKRVVVHFDRLKPCPADIRMKPVGEDLHNSDANEQPVQFPGSDLQFFEDDDHDVMVDSTETNVTRKADQPGTLQEPAVDTPTEQTPATDGQTNTAPGDAGLLNSTPSGINSDGTVSQSETVTTKSPMSRPQKRIRQSPPAQDRYPKRTRHAPSRYGWYSGW